MTQHLFIPLLGKRLRVTELTKNGALSVAARRITTEGFITLSLSSEVEDGNEIIVRNAAGNLCVNEKQPNSFKRFTVEMEFCGVNPALLGVTTNVEGYKDYAGDVAGFTVPEGKIEKRFALELWTGLSGVQVSEDETDEASGYLLLPQIDAGVLGDISVDGENAITFSMTGAATKGGNGWGVGPYDVLKDGAGLAAPLPTALDPYDHLLLIDTALAPPPVATSLQNVQGYAGATAGIPGAFTPAGIYPPEGLTDLQTDESVGNDGDNAPTTAWTAGQYVALGDGTEAHWTGTAWAAGPVAA
jgi:hypothetical protein